MTLSPYEPRPGHRMSRRSLRGFQPQEFARIRRERNLAVADLSRMAGIGQSTVHAWEAGRGTPTVNLLARVMKTLNAPIDQVVRINPSERFPSDWRVAKGLEQPELAAAAKIATTTLSGIERASLALTDANAEILSNLLGITAAEYRAAYERARLRPPGTPAT